MLGDSTDGVILTGPAFQAKGRISLVAAVALFRYFPSTSLAIVASCMLDVPS